MAKVILKGSERNSMDGARILAPADPKERLEVSIIVRRGAHAALQKRVGKLAAGNRSDGFMSREEFSRTHGADASDLAVVRRFAGTYGLAVAREHADRRTVVLSGTVAQFSAAFSVQLHKVMSSGITHRGRSGAIRHSRESSTYRDCQRRADRPRRECRT